LNPLRFTTTVTLARPLFERLHELVAEMGPEVQRAGDWRGGMGDFLAPAAAPPEVGPDRRSAGDHLELFGKTVVAGGRTGTRATPADEDVREIAAVVRSAARLADYVVLSIHAHEGAGGSTVPAEFLVTFARAMIDAGADVFVGHGPHVLRGI